MILADDEAGRRAALAKMLPMQRADFVELFEIMAGLPVTIRLLDPPLHEFLPHTEAEIAEVAKRDGHRSRQSCAPAPRAARIQPDARPSRLPPRHRLSRNLRDAGARHLRGRGRGQAAKHRQAGRPEIMIPLVATKAEELDLVKARIDAWRRCGRDRRQARAIRSAP
jgi:pyruvate,orthophosphate dikinase